MRTVGFPAEFLAGSIAMCMRLCVIEVGQCLVCMRRYAGLGRNAAARRTDR